MSIEQAIYQEMADDNTVSDLVSTRIYRQGRTPTSATLPRITYGKVDNVHVRHQTAGSGLATSRFQVDCWADTPAEASTLYDAVRKALDNFRGTMGSGSYTATVKSSVLDNDSDGWVEPIEAGQEGPCRVTMDFIVTYTETVVDNIS